MRQSGPNLRFTVSRNVRQSHIRVHIFSLSSHFLRSNNPSSFLLRLHNSTPCPNVRERDQGFLRMAMNSEQTTEEGSVELTLENYEEMSCGDAGLRFGSVRPGRIGLFSTEERRVELTLENYENRFKQQEWLRDYLVCRVREYKRTSYPDADVKIISQVQPDFVTPRGGSNAIPVEPNYGTTGVGERTPADILLSRILMASRRAYIRAQANVGAGSGYMNETMPAEASPGFTAVGVEMNDIDRSYIRAQANFGAGSGYRVEWNDDMLPALLRSSARAIREHSSSQDFLVDEAGGRFLAIHIHPPQQGDRDQGLVGVAPGTQDGPGDLARQALPSVIGGLVPLCFNLLLDDNILKAGGSPEYIKAAAYAGLGLVTVFTFLGLASKKRAKAAARVVASASTAAVSIAVVYRVSDNAYIQCFCGIMGCVATLATMAIDW